MPYVRDGAVVSRRSPYRLSIVTDIFWSVVNLIAALCVPALAPSPDLARVLVSAASFRRADTRLSLLAVPTRTPRNETASSP